jgi:hypothetical protein
VFAVTARPVRSLENLENTASTARVLNLRAVAIKFHNDPDYRARPLFKNASLNKAIIVKHRLRQHEHEDFAGYRHAATKILLPIETGDLRMGARSLFIGQKNFNQLLAQVFGISIDAAQSDARTLRILDETPSLDPFLLREQLRLQGVDAAPCYFDISEADMTRMFDFAQTEIQQLVEMSIGGGDDLAVQAFQPHAAKLARKILMNANDPALEPLRLTIQLSPQQYQEGMFCWKAFLYYKWRLLDVLPAVGLVMGQIEASRPRGVMDNDAKAYLVSAKKNIRKAVTLSCRKVTETLAVYDDAYEAMTRRGDPLRFRDFLLRAPNLFNELGERLGAIDHIISFWRFRFPDNNRTLVTPEELTDIFSDFEQSLDVSSARLVA